MDSHTELSQRVQERLKLDFEEFLSSPVVKAELETLLPSTQMDRFHSLLWSCWCASSLKTLESFKSLAVDFARHPGKITDFLRSSIHHG